MQLRADVQNLDDLPPFEETHYVSSGEMPGDPATEAAATPGDFFAYTPGLYWYPPVGAAWPGYYAGPYGYPPTPYIPQTEQNIPEGTVALKEGAEVLSADDARVGKVEQVLANAELNRATHLLISEGWLFPEKRLVPVDWVRDVTEETIHLGVTARTLERVPAYAQ